MNRIDKGVLISASQQIYLREDASGWTVLAGDDGHEIGKYDSRSEAMDAAMALLTKRVEKNGTAYREYRQAQFEPHAEQQAANVMAEYFEALAKAQGQNLEQFFAERPQAYRKYVRAVTR